MGGAKVPWEEGEKENHKTVKQRRGTQRPDKTKTVKTAKTPKKHQTEKPLSTEKKK